MTTKDATKDGTSVSDEKPIDENLRVQFSELTDEEISFLQNYDPAKEKKLWNKVDWRIVPILSMLYLIGHLDRGNIGNAKIEGLTDDLNMKGTDYNVALMVFFVPYILAEVPSNIILAMFKHPSYYLSGLVTAWGIVTTCTGVVQSFAGLAVCRFLLGLLEAGFFPGAMYLISLWYPPKKTQFRTAAFYMMSAISGAFSGLLAAAISRMRGVGGYSGWRWIFILEGIATILFGLAGFWLLPDTPSLSTKWLSEDEIRFLQLTHIATRGRPKEEKTKTSWAQKRKLVWSIITDFQMYLQALSMMSNVVPAYGLKFTLPQIMKNMGYTSQTAQLMSAPPYVLGAISAILSAWIGDRMKWRMPVIAVSQACIVISNAIQLRYAGSIQSNIAISYFAVFLSTLGIYPIPPGVNAWTINNLAGPMKRTMGIAFMLTICNIGGIIGSFIFLEREAPNYPTGFGSSLAFASAGLASTMILFFSYRYLNTKKARFTEEEVRTTYTEEELEAMGDKSPLFKYSL